MSTLADLRDILLEQARKSQRAQAGTSSSQQAQPTTEAPHNTENVALAPIGVVPMIMNEDKLKRIMAAPITELQDKFPKMRRITGRKQNLMTWDDTKPGRRKCYNLFQLSDDDEIYNLGMAIFDSLHGPVTARSICQLMLLAYNLKDVNNNFVFGAISDDLIGEEEEFDSISDAILLTAHPKTQKSILLEEFQEDYHNRVGKALAFLAASFMRLYTKSAENAKQISTHLSKRFQNFYDYPFPLDEYFPENDVIAIIKSQIDVNVTLKNTFYNFLYAGEDPEAPGKQLKEFLYGLHTAYTGMHCYVLFLKCMEAYKVDNINLANALYTKFFETELEAISVIFNDFYGTNEVQAKRHQMWKYARIFDNTFFVVLQTKTCPLFTAALAHLYHTMVPADGRQSALNIVQIQNMTKEQKLWATGIAACANNMLIEKTK